MLLKITLRHEAQGVTCTVIAKKIDEQLPGLHTLVATDTATGIVTVALPSQETLTDEQRNYLNKQWYIKAFEAFTDAQDAFTSEPQIDSDVLYEDTERRVVMLGSDYQHGITDTVLEMAERGYTSRLVYRTEGDAVRIPLDAATARKIASELEQWEKEHEDAHPF